MTGDEQIASDRIPYGHCGLWPPRFQRSKELSRSSYIVPTLLIKTPVDIKDPYQCDHQHDKGDKTGDQEKQAIMLEISKCHQEGDHGYRNVGERQRNKQGQ